MSRKPGEKPCSKCKAVKGLGEFPKQKGRPLGYGSQCKECRKKTWNENSGDTNTRRREKYKDDPEQREVWRRARKRYYAKNRERLNEEKRAYTQRRREEVITKYGGKCSCCGEKTIEFLAIDHTENNGAEERRRLKGSSGVYSKLWKSAKILPGYRVLCHNCNCAIGFYGSCPHQSLT